MSVTYFSEEQKSNQDRSDYPRSGRYRWRWVFRVQKFIYKAPVQAAAETLQTTTARQGDLELSASGTGSYVAAATASIGFDTSGQIVEMNAVIGDKVEKGQVLARLDSTSAQIAYDQAQRTFLNLTSPSAIATAENAVATAETALVSARTNSYLYHQPHRL